MSKLEDALWDTDGALKKLKSEQGRIARKNARERMLKALRKARTALDEEYPLTRKTVRRRRKNKTPAQLRRGKHGITLTEANTLLLAGVSDRYVFKLPVRPGSNIKFWAPWWMARALRAGIPAKNIAAAVRSPKLRKRIMATLRLKGV